MLKRVTLLLLVAFAPMMMIQGENAWSALRVEGADAKIPGYLRFRNLTDKKGYSDSKSGDRETKSRSQSGSGSSSSDDSSDKSSESSSSDSNSSEDSSDKSSESGSSNDTSNSSSDTKPSSSDDSSVSQDSSDESSESSSKKKSSESTDSSDASSDTKTSSSDDSSVSRDSSDKSSESSSKKKSSESADGSEDSSVSEGNSEESSEPTEDKDSSDVGSPESPDEPDPASSDEPDTEVPEAHGGCSIIPGELIDPCDQLIFENLVPNAADPGFIYQFDENNRITIEICKSDSHVTGLVDEDGNELTTTIYGYGAKNSGVCTWPGMTFETMSGEPVYVTWENNIPIEPYIITSRDGVSVVDTSFHWAFSIEGYNTYTIEDNGVPIVPHLHVSKAGQTISLQHLDDFVVSHSQSFS